jgi:hypothetical protein
MTAICTACGQTVAASSTEATPFCLACGRPLRIAGSPSVANPPVSTRPLDDSYRFPPGFEPAPMAPAKQAIDTTSISPSVEPTRGRSRAGGFQEPPAVPRDAPMRPGSGPPPAPAALWDAAWPPNAQSPAAPAASEPQARAGRFRAEPADERTAVERMPVESTVGGTRRNTASFQPEESDELEVVSGGPAFAQPPLPPPPPTPTSTVPTPTRDQDWIPPGLDLESETDSLAVRSAGSTRPAVAIPPSGSATAAPAVAAPATAVPLSSFAAPPVAASGAVSQAARCLPSQSTPPDRIPTSTYGTSDRAQSSASIEDPGIQVPLGSVPQSSAEQLAWLEYANQRARRKIIKNLILWSLCGLALVIFFWAMLVLNR